ncbi:universal stress protein [Kaistia dalseonensis]|uniref:Nucleotide-binding universal stress UspA family protein n=1 Tax=Kaistia dalseonensis TaxID=410840 RepID=A0ABU0HAA1_9HYPH|nr:universal stress protein [Kaistia dalseonensis]MCX5496615.1 universal stress protein [Kaistia dalseonensis]MDQ0439238.1 nucleotide-binding universal stress UspA family protein [Kaistia dalseonensis]
MYKHILIATDGSELADKGVDSGLALAAALHANVTAVTATRPPLELAGDVDPIDRATLDENATEILSAVAAKAFALGVSCAGVKISTANPAEAIIDTAMVRGCDLIVMASHGRRGLQRMILGSQASKVLLGTTLPVLVIR